MNRQIQIKVQNYNTSIKMLMGFFGHGSRHALQLMGGAPADVARSMQLATIATTLDRDIVFTGWRTPHARKPSQLTIAIRAEGFVDWVPGCELWAADQQSPLMIVNVRRNEHFVCGEDETLVRRPGLPAAKLAAGKTIAALRVNRLAKLMPVELFPGTRFVADGATSLSDQPEAGATNPFS